PVSVPGANSEPRPELALAAMVLAALTPSSLLKLPSTLGVTRPVFQAMTWMADGRHVMRCAGWGACWAMAEAEAARATMASTGATMRFTRWFMGVPSRS